MTELLVSKVPLQCSESIRKSSGTQFQCDSAHFKRGSNPSRRVSNLGPEYAQRWSGAARKPPTAPRRGCAALPFCVVPVQRPRSMERARARAERGVLRCWHAGESEAAARRMDQRVRSHGAGMRSVLSRPNGRPLRRSSGASDLGGGGIWHARLRRCCAVRLARTDSRSCACSSVWCRLVSDTQVPPASWCALRIGLVGRIEVAPTDVLFSGSSASLQVQRRVSRRVAPVSLRRTACPSHARQGSHHRSEGSLGGGAVAFSLVI